LERTQPGPRRMAAEGAEGARCAREPPRRPVEGQRRSKLVHLASLPKLTNLSLRDAANVTDAGLAHLAKLEKLTTLDLSGLGKVGNAGLGHLAGLEDLARVRLPRRAGNNGLEKLARSRALTHLDLAGCGSLTDAALAFVARAFPRLTHLGLEGCDRGSRERRGGRTIKPRSSSGVSRSRTLKASRRTGRGARMVRRSWARFRGTKASAGSPSFTSSTRSRSRRSLRFPTCGFSRSVCSRASAAPKRARSRGSGS